MFRSFHHGGATLDRFEQYEDVDNLSADEDAAAEVAAALGVAVASIRVEHGERLPEPTVTIPPQAQPVAPLSQAEKLDQLIAALAADKNISAATAAAIGALRDGE